MPSGRGRGIDRERKVRVLLEEDGYVVVRAAGSLGPIDLVAVMAVRDTPYSQVDFIEVKSTTDGPYKNFSRKDRQEMLDIAEKAGAKAVLCWWPPRKPPTWIPSEEWPPQNPGGIAP